MGFYRKSELYSHGNQGSWTATGGCLGAMGGQWVSQGIPQEAAKGTMGGLGQAKEAVRGTMNE